jgi:hypothetical protein
MDVASPPKRMTRARAAAASAGAAAAATATSTSTSKTTAKATKSTKTTTNSAKASTRSIKTAKSAKAAATKTPTATSASTARAAPAPRKRKVRTFEFDDDEEDDLSKDDDAMNQPVKKPRGRAKKADISSTSDPKPNTKSQSASQAEAEAEPQEAKAATRSTTTSSTSARSTTSSSTTTRAAASKTTAEKATAAKTTATKARATRGRPKKTTTEETPAVLKKQTPPTIGRTRTRKTASKDATTTNATAAKGPAKKTARGRAAAGTVTNTYSTEPTPGLKSAVSRPELKVDGALKKTVTFQEPEKENVAPAAASKAKVKAAAETSATGMRAKPVRKPAAASGRTTRASARAATTEQTEKKPLSPKKDVQNRSLSRDAGSDDELATYEKTPLRPLMKSPVKPSSSVRKIELPRPEKEKDENSPKQIESSFTTAFASPARRPPASPFKDAMKSPAKRVDGATSLLFASANPEVQGTQTPAKPTMLQSPAKRPQMPLPAFQQPSQDQAGPHSPGKMSSLLSTPAKRPVSPIKLPGSSALRAENDHKNATEVTQDPPALEEPTKNELLQSQITSEIEYAIAHRSTSPVIKEQLDPVTEESDSDDELQLVSPSEAQLEFPGRLSAVLPRHADPALKNIVLPMPDPVMQSSAPEVPQLHMTEDAQMSDSDVTADYVDALSSAEPLKEGRKEADFVDALSSVGSLKEDPKGVTADEEQARQSEPVSDEKLAQPTGAKPDSQAEAQQVHEVAVEVESMDATGEHASEQQNLNVFDSKFGEVSADNKDDEANLVAAPDTPSKKPTAASLETDNKDSVSDSEDELALSDKPPTKFQNDTSISEPVSTTTHRSLFSGGAIPKLPESLLRKAERAIQSTRRSRYSPYPVYPPRASIYSYDLSPRKRYQTSKPEKPEPGDVEPEKTESEEVQPETAGSEDAESMEVELKNNEPEEIQLETVESEITETKRTEPAESQPETVESEITETKRTEPAESQPETSQSENTENKGIESEQTGSDESEPAKTETTKAKMIHTQAASISAPIEEEDDEFSLLSDKDFPAVQPTPLNGFFDDEMKIRADMERQEDEAAIYAALKADIDAKFDKHGFQDLGLMQHARLTTPRPGDRMSFIDELNPNVNDGTVSEASQEYGDENAVPIDPFLLGQNPGAKPVSFPAVTPKRPLASTHFHTTVSKVPLKRGDDSPPRDSKRHCSSASKLSASKFSFRRPDDENEHATGYEDVESDEESEMPPVTPSKSAAWSSMGTPARTPRRDLNPGLLRGAVVFVDVHTAEGADAGRLFVELLLSMGARCVKSWPWNPNNTDGEPDASKVGITHVVFKDGSRRTLEKVVESNGLVKIVQCGWVLE